MKFSKKALFVLTVITLVSLLLLGLVSGNSPFRDSMPAVLVKREMARGISYLLSIYDPWKNKKKAKVTPKIKINLPEYTMSEYELLRMLPGQKIKVLEFNNPLLKKSSFVFEYQDYHDNKLRQLVEKYKLDRFLVKGEDDFKTLVQLRDWVKNRWKHGGTLKKLVQFNNYDSLEILDLAEQGEKFACGEYSYTYVQCVAAVGGVARVVSLGSRDRRRRASLCGT